MEFRSHWIFDDFYPSAGALRQKIDDLFIETVALHQPFSARTIWNYWHIPELYTYLRTEPRHVYPAMHPAFMEFIRHFAAKKFGLVVPHNPYLSMYVNGCGQNIHNDAKNGRLAYVFSLTRWKERHFTGGETFLYKLGDDAYKRSFTPNAGQGFYDAVEPMFNRLAIFDDRVPHAVNFIQGSMNPLDARFVLHGHMEEPAGVPFAEGGLHGVDLREPIAHFRASVIKIFESYGYHGFITLQVHVEPSGITQHAYLKHMQLMPLNRYTDNLTECLNKAIAVVQEYVWPEAEQLSRLVFALSSAPLRTAV